MIYKENIILHDLQPGKPEDIMTICYTSGTTGISCFLLIILDFSPPSYVW